MDKLGNVMKKLGFTKKMFFDVFANLSVCFSILFWHLCGDVLLTFKRL